MTGPMGTSCPVCGRFWNARGCTPGDCKGTPEPAAPACECCGAPASDDFMPYGIYCAACGTDMIAPTGDRECRIVDGRAHHGKWRAAPAAPIEVAPIINSRPEVGAPVDDVTDRRNRKAINAGPGAGDTHLDRSVRSLLANPRAGEKPTRIQDGLVPLGPEDTYNGVKVSSLCMDCRDGIARYEHGMQASVTLCPACSAKVQAGLAHFAGVPIAEFCDYDRKAIAAMHAEGKIGIAGMCASCSAKVDAATPVGALPTVAHPGPWRWGEDGDDNLRDANGDCLIDSESGAWPTDDRVRALTEMAPDLEEFARDCANGDAGPGDRISARASELLARIEERSKGGNGQ